MRRLAILLAVLSLPLLLPSAAAAPVCDPTGGWPVRACADPEAASVSWRSSDVRPPPPYPSGLPGGVPGFRLEADPSSASFTQGTTHLEASPSHARACASLFTSCLDTRTPPTVPTDPAVWVDAVEQQVDGVRNHPLLRCLPRVCPIPV